MFPEFVQMFPDDVVQLFNLFQHTTGYYDNCDVKLMLHNLGLVGKAPCDLLIDVSVKMTMQCCGKNKHLKSAKANFEWCFLKREISSFWKHVILIVLSGVKFILLIL